MASPTVTLTSSALTGSPVIIRCNTVLVGMKKNNSVKPIENGTAQAEVSTMGFDNCTYSIQGVTITGEAGTLTYKNLLELLKLQYDGTNAPTLTVRYGKGNATAIDRFDTDLSIDTDPVKVILQNANVTFDAKETVGAHKPSATLVFVETR